jgi:hypothetical protein
MDHSLIRCEQATWEEEMKLRTLARALALIMAFLSAIGLAAPAIAASDDLAHYRDQLTETGEQLKLVRGSISDLERMIAEGRYHLSYLPVAGSKIPVLVTQDEALKFWTMEYVLTREAAGAPFTTAGLEDFLKQIRRVSRTVKNELEDIVKALEARERALTRKRNELEQKVADLSGPQGTGRCADLQRVDRWRELGAAAYVNRGALEHYVTQTRDTGRGWVGNFTLTWTAPPDRICVGEVFDITLTATNGAPVEDALLGRAAQVGMRLKPAWLVDACNNPPPFDPDAAAFVAPNDRVYTNTCKVTVHNVGDGRTPISLLSMSLTAVPLTGKVDYIYQ